MATDSAAYTLHEGTTVPLGGFGAYTLRGDDGTAETRARQG